MELIDLIDMILRIIVIIFMYTAAVYIQTQSLKAKEYPTKRNFLVNFSCFFFFTGINYTISEINLQKKMAEGLDASIFPPIINNSDAMFLTNPVDSDVFLILFFLLAAIPMLYAVEKNILRTKHMILTTLGIFGLGLIISIIFIRVTLFQNIVIIYGWVIMLFLSLRIIFVYLGLARKSTGEIRSLGLLMGWGFIIMFLGTIFTSMELLFGDVSEIVGHITFLVATIMIFRGVFKMQ